MRVIVEVAASFLLGAVTFGLGFYVGRRSAFSDVLRWNRGRSWDRSEWARPTKEAK